MTESRAKARGPDGQRAGSHENVTITCFWALRGNKNSRTMNSTSRGGGCRNKRRDDGDKKRMRGRGGVMGDERRPANKQEGG